MSGNTVKASIGGWAKPPVEYFDSNGGISHGWLAGRPARLVPMSSPLMNRA
jgi:hypothetical protein